MLVLIGINKMKQTKKFKVQDMRDERNHPITLKVNKKIWDEFKIIMDEQKLIPSAVFNQFMKMTNDLLKSNDGGEIAFIF